MSTESSPAEAGVTTRVSLSVVMPGLNEEASVAGAVGRVVEALEDCTDEFEVIVIDDGSTDGMGEIADDLARKDPRVRVLHNAQNLNYGISLRRGLAAARCEWVVHDGMDLPLAPGDFQQFFPSFPDADVIVATRRDRAAHSPWRRVTSLVNRELLRILFGPRTRDLNFVQFYRKSFVDGLRLRSTSPAFVTPEIIMRAERVGARVREVEADFQRRQAGQAHFGRPRDILWTLRDMSLLRLHTWLRGWRS